MAGSLVNVAFKRGELWTLDATMHDSAGNPLNLAGCIVKWRLAFDTVVLIELSIGSGITLVNGGIAGECLIQLTPAQQITLNIVPAFYQHEAQVILADGVTVSDQFAGYVQVMQSLF
jgi:hypothetical protein